MNDLSVLLVRKLPRVLWVLWLSVVAHTAVQAQISDHGVPNFISGSAVSDEDFHIIMHNNTAVQASVDATIFQADSRGECRAFFRFKDFGDLVTGGGYKSILSGHSVEAVDIVHETCATGDFIEYEITYIFEELFASAILRLECDLALGACTQYTFSCPAANFTCQYSNTLLSTGREVITFGTP